MRYYPAVGIIAQLAHAERVRLFDHVEHEWTVLCSRSFHRRAARAPVTPAAEQRVSAGWNVKGAFTRASEEHPCLLMPVPAPAGISMFYFEEWAIVTTIVTV